MMAADPCLPCTAKRTALLCFTIDNQNAAPGGGAELLDQGHELWGVGVSLSVSS